MVVRNRSIGFASGALVFPGGKVDTQDSALLHTDLAEGFDGLDPFEAACRVAALREAYEEAGVLLAHRASDSALIPGARHIVLPGSHIASVSRGPGRDPVAVMRAGLDALFAAGG